MDPSHSSIGATQGLSRATSGCRSGSPAAEARLSISSTSSRTSEWYIGLRSQWPPAGSTCAETSVRRIFWLLSSQWSDRAQSIARPAMQSALRSRRNDCHAGDARSICPTIPPVSRGCGRVCRRGRLRTGATRSNRKSAANRDTATNPCPSRGILSYPAAQQSPVEPDAGTRVLREQVPEVVQVEVPQEP